MASKWVAQIFQSQMAKTGGLARRKISSIQKYASLNEVELECAKRGYHIVENGNQWIIFCNKAKVQIIL